MSSTSIAFLYAAVLHLAGLAAMVVLVLLGKLSWAEGGPIIGYLLGFGAGVPVSIATSSKTATTPPTS